MKVSYVSDLHLDFHIPFTKNQIKFEQRTKRFINTLISSDKGSKEVLVIAGDISHFNLQSYWCVDEFSKHYEHVLIVVGNHDYYLISKNQSNKYKNNSQNRVDELSHMVDHIENVYMLTGDNIVFEYKDVRFGGVSMWYPIATTSQKMFFNNISNDSQLIKGLNIEKEHTRNQMQYETLLEKNIDVMISHFPVINIDSHFKYNSTACYLTPVRDISAKHWVFGHSHEQKVYEKPYCSFYMNAIGYPEERLDLSIKSFEVSALK